MSYTALAYRPPETLRRPNFEAKPTVLPFTLWEAALGMGSTVMMEAKRR